MTATTQIVTVSTNIVPVECCECGVLFGLGDGFMAERRKDHRIWYCPSGHQQHYPAKSAAELATEERDAARSLAQREAQRRKYAEAEARLAEYQRRAAKGQLTKIRNRIAKGVCPCCNQSFPDLAAHMAGEHPEFIIPAVSEEPTA